jgi:hypothetical protein
MTSLTPVEYKPRKGETQSRKRLAVQFILAFLLVIMTFYTYIDYHEYVHTAICWNEGGKPQRTSFTSINCTSSDKNLAYLDIYNELIASIMFPTIIIIFLILLIYIISNSKPETRKVVSVWD